MGVLVVSGDERRAAVDGERLFSHELYTKMHALFAASDHEGGGRRTCRKLAGTAGAQDVAFGLPLSAAGLGASLSRQRVALRVTPVTDRSRPPVRCAAQISTSWSRSNLRRALIIALCSALMRFFASGWRHHQAAL